MPRKTKDQEKIENEETLVKEEKKATTKKKTTAKKETKKEPKKEKVSTTKKTRTKATEKIASKNDEKKSKKDETEPKKTKKVSTKKSSTSSKKTSTTPKKSSVKKEKTEEEKPKTKKVVTKTTKSKKDEPKETKKVATKKASTSSKKTSTTPKKSSVKKEETVEEEKKPKAKKAVTKTTKSKKDEPKEKKKETKKKTSTTKKKKETAKTKKKTTTKSKVADIIEYYDLPYRYNQTIVKVLAQTPTTLFVYWDISDDDRKNYEKEFGKNFFSITKPVLIIHNNTYNYSFEIDINDFANSWYIHVEDGKCDYVVELGRRPIQDINNPENPNEIKKHFNDYIYVTTSNHIESPNDKVLIKNLQNPVKFRNIKTGNDNFKDITKLLKNTSKIYNIYDLYKAIFQNENIDDIFDFANPSSRNLSSGSFSSKFK